MPFALIVEDEPEANELLAMLVQLRGYQTESAFTGGEALEKARVRRPDVVFLDLMLPDMNGYDVCQALKCERTTSAIPVVMVTARLASENRIQGFRAGAIEYVPKPYTPDQIFDALTRANDWKKGLVDGPSEGAIALDPRDEADTLRGLSRLRSLLLARTPLSEEAARELDHHLQDVAALAVGWGRRRGVGPAASLRHRLDGRGIRLALRDQSGWFADDSPLRPGGPVEILSRCGLGEVSFDEEAGEVVLAASARP